MPVEFGEGGLVTGLPTHRHVLRLIRRNDDVGVTTFELCGDTRGKPRVIGRMAKPDLVDVQGPSSNVVDLELTCVGLTVEGHLQRATDVSIDAQFGPTREHWQRGSNRCGEGA